MPSGTWTLWYRVYKKLIAFGCFVLGLTAAALGAPSLSQDVWAKGIGLLEAVYVTLEKQPDILIQRQNVEFSQGRLQEQAGAFDTSLLSSIGHEHSSTPLTLVKRASSGGLEVESIDDVTIANLGLTKQFRTGVVVSPTVGVIRSDGDTTNPGLPPTNASTVTFLINIPLLKGLGVTATGANELAAKRDLAASVHALRHSISQDVLATVVSYWNLLGSVVGLEERRLAQLRAERNLGDVRRLIECNERPASDLEQASADVAAKTASRMDAERNVTDSKHALGLAMGLPLEKTLDLPLPEDAFPAIGARDLEKIGSATHYFVEQSLHGRADYLASIEARESAKILLAQARNNLLPSLNLQLGVGYSGLDEGASPWTFASSLGNNIPGYSVQGQVTYLWPFKNNTARGQYRQRTASYEAAALSCDDLARAISTKVSQDLADLKNIALVVSGYEEAVNRYRKAVENERRKYLLGMSTLNDLITLEDRLTLAVLNTNSAQTSFAKAIAQLRFETGALLAEKDGRVSVAAEDLTTIPFLEDIARTPGRKK